MVNRIQPSPKLRTLELHSIALQMCHTSTQLALILKSLIRVIYSGTMQARLCVTVLQKLVVPPHHHEPTTCPRRKKPTEMHLLTTAQKLETRTTPSTLNNRLKSTHVIMEAIVRKIRSTALPAIAAGYAMQALSRREKADERGKCDVYDASTSLFSYLTSFIPLIVLWHFQ